MNPALEDLALRVLGHDAGPNSGAAALEAAAERGYDDLVRVVAPLIGQVGIESLTGRALHLAAREHPCLASTPEQEQQAAQSFAQVIACLKQQDPAAATAAVAAFFATLTGLLHNFIGGPLTERLLRKAWPDAFSTRPRGEMGGEKT